MNLSRSYCKSCGASIVWMKSRNLRWVPVDPNTIDENQLEWIQDEDGKAPRFAQNLGHVAHFATCPERNSKARLSDDVFRRNGSLETAYQELQLIEGAHAVVVRAAYRALSMLYHPDTGRGD